MAIVENALFHRACLYRCRPRRNPTPRTWPEVLELLARPT